MSKIALAIGLLLLITSSIAQQDPLLQPVDSTLNQADRLSEIRTAPRGQLDVIAPTIAPEEIDRAVLNRLLQEIASRPEVAQIRLGVDESELQNIYIAISNARIFINDSQMANVRAMCEAWDTSTLTGEARISEALDAYTTREQFTKDFIARYYRVVLGDIESNLSATAKTSFNAYMDDRRRRMASAGTVSFGSIVQNIYNGAETVRFHCRTQL